MFMTNRQSSRRWTTTSALKFLRECSSHTLQSVGKNEGGEILKSTKIVDTYDTDTVHSVTIRFEFSSNERTLSSAEVQKIMDKIIQIFLENGVKAQED
mgnify:CR=1 FL=1